MRFVFEPASGDRSGAESFPEELDDFRLIERLGGGGMGVVYRAEQRLYFPGARERFRRETEAVARLQHPGIVAIHTVGEEKGLPYFAMELLPGRTLSAVIHSLSGRAPETLEGSDLGQSGSWVAACVEVVRQLAEAVEHAHQRGIMHRDVKPSNAMRPRRARLPRAGCGRRLSHWEGCDPGGDFGIEGCMVTMDGDQTVRAYFEPE